MAIEENIILTGLVKNQDYFLKVLPFINEKLFNNKVTASLFKRIKTYNDMYNSRPSIPVLELHIDEKAGFTQEQHTEAKDIINYINKTDIDNIEWLISETLEWIRLRMFYNALLDGASEFDKGTCDMSLPDKLNQALAVTFDEEIGLSLSDLEKRWELYNTKEEQIPFRLDILNTITNGGISKGTLNLIMSSDTGGFKSGTMCSLASDYIRDGKNVLYFTFEMSESKIMERIDANLLDENIDDIVKLGKETYMDRMKIIQEKSNGRLVVKQFPTSMGHTGHLRHFIRECKLKLSFEPDIIFVDYINIMASSRLKKNDIGNSYGYIKAISEELRGLAIEFNIPLWTATQSNRGGTNNENLSLSDISESFALTYAADICLGIVTTPEFDAQNKLLYIQLKNRYNDKNMNNKFFLSVNKAKMRLYDIASNQTAFGGNTINQDNEEKERFQSITGFRKPRTSINL